MINLKCIELKRGRRLPASDPKNMCLQLYRSLQVDRNYFKTCIQHWVSDCWQPPHSRTETSVTADQSELKKQISKRLIHSALNCLVLSKVKQNIWLTDVLFPAPAAVKQSVTNVIKAPSPCWSPPCCFPGCLRFLHWCDSRWLCCRGFLEPTEETPTNLQRQEDVTNVPEAQYSC